MADLHMRGAVMLTKNDLSKSTVLNVVQFQSKSIFCIECRNIFIFSTGEQEFFRSYALSNEPKRCQYCRILARMRREGKSIETLIQLNCVKCGEKTTVPFLPKDDKTITCPSCFRQRRQI